MAARAAADATPASVPCLTLASAAPLPAPLLPRSQAAALHVAPTTLFGGPVEDKKGEEEDYNGRRKSGRQQAQVQAVSTLRLVEMHKQQVAAVADAERARAAKEKRGRILAEVIACFITLIACFITLIAC